MAKNVKVTPINIELDYLICYGELLPEVSNVDFFDFIRKHLAKKDVYLHIIKSVENGIANYTDIKFSKGKREDNSSDAKHVYNMCTYVNHKIKRKTAIIIPIKNYQKALDIVKIIYEYQLFNTFSILEKVVYSDEDEYQDDYDEEYEEDDYIFYYSKPLLYNVSYEDKEWNIMACYLNNIELK